MGGVHFPERHGFRPGGLRYGLQHRGKSHAGLRERHDRVPGFAGFDASAQARISPATARRGEFATGVLYVEPDKEDFISLLGMVDEPLASLPLARVRPGKEALDEVMEALR